MKTVRILVLDDEDKQRINLKGSIQSAFECPPNPSIIKCDPQIPQVNLKSAIDQISEDFLDAVASSRFESLPDLVIIDWMLGDIIHPDYPTIGSGMDIFLELVAPLLMQYRQITTRFVLATAYMEGGEDERVTNLGVNYRNKIQAALNAGLFDFWRKPFSCLLYTSPSPRDRQKSRMPSSA